LAGFNERHGWNSQKADADKWEALCRKPPHARIQNINTPTTALAATLLPFAAILSIYNGPNSEKNPGSAFLPAPPPPPGGQATYADHGSPDQNPLVTAGGGNAGAGMAQVARGNLKTGLQLTMLGLATASIGAAGGYLYGTNSAQTTPNVPDTPIAEALQGCPPSHSAFEGLNNKAQALIGELAAGRWKKGPAMFYKAAQQMIQILVQTRDLLNAEGLSGSEASTLSKMLGEIRTKHIEPYLSSPANRQWKDKLSHIAASMTAIQKALNGVYLKTIG
jgi:hypothetical protein